LSSVAVSFLDVGQGDCTIAVDLEHGNALMFDCPEGGHEAALMALDAGGATHLKLAMVSHQHLDHLGGIYSTVTRFPTERVRINPLTVVPEDPDEKKKLLAAMRALSGLPRRGVAFCARATTGDRGTIGDFAWEVLVPDMNQLFAAQAKQQPNHASVILRLSTGERSVVLSADSDEESWAALLGGRDVKADVLQLPHHGGEFGAALDMGALIDAVDPSICVISVGSSNRYGHPAASTLAAIRARRANRTTYCTQLNDVCAGRTCHAGESCAGSVEVTFTDGGITVRPPAAEHRLAVKAFPAPQCV
jgi:competence protein ComEC